MQNLGQMLLNASSHVFSNVFRKSEEQQRDQQVKINQDVIRSELRGLGKNLSSFDAANEPIFEDVDKVKRFSSGNGEVKLARFVSSKVSANNDGKEVRKDTN